jgi:hypothetical protein
MSARPRKVQVIVLGRGLAAIALAERLVAAGKQIALLAEAPVLEQGTRAGYRGWHRSTHAATMAAQGKELLQQWQAEGVPGLTTSVVDGPFPLWLIDYDRLFPELIRRIAAGEKSHVAESTRVRGISVIENAVLGAIAEDSRYDARQIINAAEDERYAAFARMLRHREQLALTPFSPSDTPEPRLTSEYGAGWSGALPYLRDGGELTVGKSTVTGAWHVRGVAGWPLLALGCAVQLARHLIEEGVVR